MSGQSLRRFLTAYSAYFNLNDFKKNLNTNFNVRKYLLLLNQKNILLLNHDIFFFFSSLSNWVSFMLFYSNSFLEEPDQQFVQIIYTASLGK
jgi:hypothetical protein